MFRWQFGRRELTLVATSRRGGVWFTLEVSGADAFLDGGLFAWLGLREWLVARWVRCRLGR